MQLKRRPVLVSRARPIYGAAAYQLIDVLIYVPAAYRCSDYKLNIDKLLDKYIRCF